MAMTYIAPANNSMIAYCYDPEQTGTYNGHPYKGVVMAKMENTKYDAVRKVDKLASDSGLVVFPVTAVPELANSYQGYAYCSAEDEFNLNDGMRIARMRMLSQYHSDMANAMFTVFKKVDVLAQALFDAYISHDVGVYKNNSGRSENYGKN